MPLLLPNPEAETAVMDYMLFSERLLIYEKCCDTSNDETRTSLLLLCQAMTPVPSQAKLLAGIIPLKDALVFAIVPGMIEVILHGSKHRCHKSTHRTGVTERGLQKHDART